MFNTMSAFLHAFRRVDYGENIRTLHGIAHVWPKPGKVPRQNNEGV
jgi:hypothetical protein